MTVAQIREEARARKKVKTPLPELPPSELRKCKRVASTSFEEAEKKLMERTKEWNACSNIVTRARKLSEDYKESYGGLSPPPILVHDENLDADES